MCAVEVAVAEEEEEEVEPKYVSARYTVTSPVPPPATKTRSGSGRGGPVNTLARGWRTWSRMEGWDSTEEIRRDDSRRGSRGG